MKLRGKDYCNCDHAKMLRKAIEEAVAALPKELRFKAHSNLEAALDEDHAACMDLWGDLRESEIGK